MVTISDENNLKAIYFACQGEYLLAVKEWEKSFINNPTCLAPILDFSFGLIMVEQYSEAETILEKGKSLYPEDRTIPDYQQLVQRCKQSRNKLILRRSRWFQLVATDKISNDKLNCMIEKGEEILVRIGNFLGYRFNGTILVEIGLDHLFPITDFVGRTVHPKICLNLWHIYPGALTHEITHVILSGKNRFLMEGIAMYLERKFTPERFWPFPDNYLEESLLKFEEFLIPLNTLIKETEEQLTFFFFKNLNTFSTRLAYAEAGSFIGFLVNQFSLPKFKQLFQMINLSQLNDNQEHVFSEIYQTSFTSLVTQWTAFLHSKTWGQT